MRHELLDVSWMIWVGDALILTLAFGWCFRISFLSYFLWAHRDNLELSIGTVGSIQANRCMLTKKVFYLNMMILAYACEFSNDQVIFNVRYRSFLWYSQLSCYLVVSVVILRRKQLHLYQWSAVSQVRESQLCITCEPSIAAEDFIFRFQECWLLIRQNASQLSNALLILSSGLKKFIWNTLVIPVSVTVSLFTLAS